MAEYATKREKKETFSGDLILAMMIAAGVVVGDFILTHLPLI
jgi:hypothetical protein